MQTFNAGFWHPNTGAPTFWYKLFKFTSFSYLLGQVPLPVRLVWGLTL